MLGNYWTWGLPWSDGTQGHSIAEFLMSPFLAAINCTQLLG